MTDIVVVRHGSTELNEEDVIIGHLPVGLSEKGVREARIVGRKLKDELFDALLTSDLPRAEQTARIINALRTHPLPITQEPSLREIDYGVDAGRKKVEVEREEPQYHADPDYRHRKGESFTELYDRVTKCCMRLKGERILLVTHSGCIRTLFAFAKKEPLRQHLAMKIPHTSILRLRIEGQKLAFISYDDARKRSA